VVILATPVESSPEITSLWFSFLPAFNDFGCIIRYGIFIEACLFKHDLSPAIG
jgi:hypothetical protein